MSSRVRWLTTALTLGCLLGAGEARADWLLAPFIGSAFAGQTTFIDVERASGSNKLIFGGSGAWLSDGLFGLEADFAYSPRFFERESGGLVVSSTASTLSGSVMLAVPLSVTRESLRPYLVGGASMLHAAGEDIFGIFSFGGNQAGYNVGGGAIGLVTPRTGFRFEIRQFRSFARDEDPFTGERRSRFGFWRATVGVVIRY